MMFLYACSVCLWARWGAFVLLSVSVSVIFLVCWCFHSAHCIACYDFCFVPVALLFCCADSFAGGFVLLFAVLLCWCLCFLLWCGAFILFVALPVMLFVLCLLLCFLLCCYAFFLCWLLCFLFAEV